MPQRVSQVRRLMLMSIERWENAVNSASWPNIEDHSQIVRFVSSFIADTLTGISRGFVFMVLFYPLMPYSGNKNVEYHSNNGYWDC